MKIALYEYETPSSLPNLMIGAIEEGVVWIDWFIDREIQLKIIEKHHKTNNFYFETTTFHSQLSNEFDSYFKGDLKKFKTPIQLIGTDFQIKVWKALLNVPYGETSTYSKQSLQVGDLKAIRAVASANGANPLSVVVPCHRIIGKNGALTGYRGGLSNKQFLLNHEAIFSNKPIQGSLF